MSTSYFRDGAEPGTTSEPDDNLAKIAYYASQNRFPSEGKGVPWEELGDGIRQYYRRIVSALRSALSAEHQSDLSRLTLERNHAQSTADLAAVRISVLEADSILIFKELVKVKMDLARVTAELEKMREERDAIHPPVFDQGQTGCSWTHSAMMADAEDTEAALREESSRPAHVDPERYTDQALGSQP